MQNILVKAKQAITVFGLLTVGPLVWPFSVDGPALFPTKEMVEKQPEKPLGANRIRDLRLTIQVRKILAEDKELNQLNIGVSVKDGIIRLWGPVPDSNRMKQTLDKVGKVKLVFDVKNEMYLGILEDFPEPLFIKE